MPRWIAGLLLLSLACCGGCYTRRLLPAMTICVRDQQDRPIAGLSGKWSGYATEGIVWKRPFGFDSDGCAHLERYDLHTNALRLAGVALLGLFPHQSGLVTTTAEVHISLPNGYEVDETASGLKRTSDKVSGDVISWENRDDMMFYLARGHEAGTDWPDAKFIPLYPGRGKPPDEFVIWLLEPASRPAVEVRLVLRPKAATRPVTSPTTVR